jgi:hypothetical protein
MSSEEEPIIPDSVPTSAFEEAPPSPDSLEFEEEARRATFVMEVVLPVFLDAGNAMMEGAPDAQEKINALIAGLERNAQDANEGEDGFWTAAVALCKAVFIERDRALNLVKRSEDLDKREGFSWKTLCVLCYIGGSMDAHALPRLAVMLHMAIAEYVHRHTSHNQELYEQRIVPWFARFWERIFENARFRFYAPTMVEWDLRDALKSPPAIRVQRVLRAAAFGLWEPLPEKGRAWFEVGEEAPSYLNPLA